MTSRTAFAAAALAAMLGPAVAQQPPAPPPQVGPGPATAAGMPRPSDMPMAPSGPHRPAFDPNHGPGPDRLPDGSVPSRPDDFAHHSPGPVGDPGQPAHVRLSKGDASVDLACGGLAPQACLDAAAKAMQGISGTR